MKKITIVLVLFLLSGMSNAQTLQTVTDAGNRTTNSVYMNTILNTTIGGSSTMRVGKQNIYYSGSNTYVIGTNNIVSTSNATIVGYQNSVTNGSSSSVFGKYNSVAGHAPVVVGYSNNVQTASKHVMTFGRANTTAGTSTMSIGTYNVAGGTYSGAIGISNSVNASYAFAIGYGINNTISNSLMIGPSDWSKLTILNSGNVGFGTTTPQERLEVVGVLQTVNRNAEYAKWDNMKIWSDGGNSYIQSNGDENGLHLKSNTANKIFLESTVGVGTTTIPTGYQMVIDGKVGARKIVVSQTTWPDYVFQKSYKLIGLKELEAYIISNKHLPDVPSAEEVSKNGIDLGDNQAVLLKKIEELTLYMIEQAKLIETQGKQLEAQLNEIKLLKEKVNK